MPPLPIFAGSLQPKKKAELQEIANALRISDAGTNYELQQRIKKHLENNPELEEKEEFKGLYGRKGRRGSVQPASQAQVSVPSSRFAPAVDTIEESQPSPSPRRTLKRVHPLDPIDEIATPQQDLRNISTMLKHPLSPSDSSPHSFTQRLASETYSTEGEGQDHNNSAVYTHAQATQNASHVYAFPPTPSPDPELASVASALARVRWDEAALRKTRTRMLSTRAFLSDSGNIWSLTALIELAYILLTVIPWTHVYFHYEPLHIILQFPYFPLSTLQSPVLWLTLLHWSIPTLILPSLAGIFISFHTPTPTVTRDISGVPTSLSMPFDPLSASIARVACHVAYPFDRLRIGGGAGVDEVGATLDVLGVRWRVIDASVTAAFAFAEAVFASPGVFAERRRAEHPGKVEIVKN